VLRVTADTNILVSGLVYRRGKPYDLLRMALDGSINLNVSQHILNEMADVLARKFYATPEEIAEATLIVRDAARVVTPAVQLDVIREDPADNRILECAVAAGSDYIVTGDKDLLRLGTYDSIKILTVSDFLNVGRAR
jgi:putative PIN family toxin of toxin-antitoxin system